MSTPITLKDFDLAARGDRNAVNRVQMAAIERAKRTGETREAAFVALKSMLTLEGREVTPGEAMPSSESITVDDLRAAGGPAGHKVDTMVRRRLLRAPTSNYRDQLAALRREVETRPMRPAAVISSPPSPPPAPAVIARRDPSPAIVSDSSTRPPARPSQPSPNVQNSFVNPLRELRAAIDAIPRTKAGSVAVTPERGRAIESAAKKCAAAGLLPNPVAWSVDSLLHTADGRPVWGAHGIDRIILKVDAAIAANTLPPTAA